MALADLDVRPNTDEITEKAKSKLNVPSKTTSSEPEHKDIPKPTLSNRPAKKNGLMQKFQSTFLQGRNIEDIGTYVVKEILIPTIFDGIANSAKAAIDSFFYGESRPVQSSRTNYNSLTRGGTGSRVSGGGINENRLNVGSRNGYNYNRAFTNIIFDIHKDAEDVMEYLFDYAQEYNRVPVGEFYDASGDYAEEQGIRTNTSSYSIGWYPEDLERVQIKRCIDGWYIDLPQPRSLR